MEQVLEQIRDQQKESWNKFSPGWKKWDDLMMEFMKPMRDEMISQLNLHDHDYVLDIACGTGEPGMTIAEIVKKGKVILTDLSEGMLDVAREHVAKRNIQNIDIQLCDASELPFADNTFDAISCRFGYMFFPDMLKATKEMVRVLKPGGKIVTSVWHVPEKNFWVTVIGGTINRNMQIQSPPPEAPGMFRCAKNGLIEDLFKQGGLKNTRETEVLGKMNCGSADVFWNMMTDVAAPFVAALNKADDAMKAKIKNEVFAQLNEKFPDGNVNIDSSSLVVYGEK